MVPLKEEAPGGRHTTRSGASSRWRVGELRFGTAMCDGRFPVSRPARRLRRAGAPAFTGASAASSDLAAGAVSAEPGTAPASGSVSVPLGASALARPLSGVAPFEHLASASRPPSGPAPCGSVPSRWRTVTLTHSAGNRKSPPWPNPMESGGKPRKTALSGPWRRGSAGKAPPSGRFHSPVGPGNSPDRTTTTGTARDQIRRLVAPCTEGPISGEPGPNDSRIVPSMWTGPSPSRPTMD